MFLSIYSRTRFTQRRRYSKSAAIFAGLTAGAVLLTTGCGGGSGSSNVNPNATQRDLAFAIVHSLRGTAGSVDHVSKAADQAEVTNDPLELDTEYNLFYRTTLGENPDLRFDYFEDAAASRPAGYFNGNFEGELGEFPLNITLKFDVTKGNRPEKGDINLRLTSATNGTLEGIVTDYTSGDTIELDLAYRALDDTAVGMAILTPGPLNHRTGDKPIYFTNFVAHADDTFNGNLKVGTGAGVPTGTVFVDDDNSGNLQLQVTGGTLRADWDDDGKGTIRFPDGATQSIADFDSAQP
ncbi:MAG: hypothetical protein V4671_06875 [Armatimonadota bacterium]